MKMLLNSNKIIALVLLKAKQPEIIKATMVANDNRILDKRKATTIKAITVMYSGQNKISTQVTLRINALRRCLRAASAKLDLCLVRI